METNQVGVDVIEYVVEFCIELAAGVFVHE